MNINNYINGLSQSDLSKLIQEDADDTVQKLSGPLQLFSALAEVDAMDSDPLITDKAQGWLGGDQGTILLGNGDVIHVVIDRTYPEMPAMGVVWSQNGVTSTDWLYSYPIFLDAVDGFHALSGKLYTAEEVLGILCAQDQASIVMSRLASLARNDTIDLPAILAALSDFQGSMTPDVASLITTLSGLGNKLNPATLLASLQQVYTPFASASVSDETIEFNDGDFTVKSFYGTYIKGALLTGAQILGSVFMVAGGAIGLIIGSITSAISYIADYAKSNGPLSTEAELNMSATHYEFSAPVFQREVPMDLVSQSVRDKVSAEGIVLLRYPMLNIYVWAAKDVLRCEAYLPMTMRRTPEGSQWMSKTRTLFTADRAPNSTTNAILTATLDYAGDRDVNGGLSAYCPWPLITDWNTFNSDSAFYGPIGADVSDEALRERVWETLYSSYWLAKNIKFLYTNGANPTDTYGFAVGEIRPPVSSGGPLDADNALVLKLYQKVHYTHQYTLPTWDNMVNDYMPVVSGAFSELTDAEFLLMINEGNGAARNVPYSLRGMVRGVDDFRNTFLINPPNFTKGSILRSIATTVLTTAAIAAVGAAATFAVRKALRTAVAKRQAKADEAYYAYIGKDDPGYQDPAVLQTYLKNSRKADKLSKFLGAGGTSGAGFTDAGSNFSETLSSVATVETVDALMSGDVKGAVDSILGGDDPAASDVSLSSLMELITGPKTITPPVGDEI